MLFDPDCTMDDIEATLEMANGHLHLPWNVCRTEIYSGTAFPDWKGDAFIGGLSSKSLVRIEFDGTQAREAARYDMGQRIREVEQGPDGNLWLLEDEREGSGGRLLRLSPS